MSVRSIRNEGRQYGQTDFSNERLAIREMKAPPRPPGTGRVAFLASLNVIRREIEGGDYLTTIHARHAAELGITYSAFRKLVARYAPEAKPVRRPYGSASPRTPTPPVVPAPTPRTAPGLAPTTPPPATGNPSHARHEPTGRPTFVHDGRTKEGEPEQLFGPGFLPGSRK